MAPESCGAFYWDPLLQSVPGDGFAWEVSIDLPAAPHIQCPTPSHSAPRLPNSAPRLLLPLEPRPSAYCGVTCVCVLQVRNGLRVAVDMRVGYIASPPPPGTPPPSGGGGDGAASGGGDGAAGSGGNSVIGSSPSSPPDGAEEGLNAGVLAAVAVGGVVVAAVAVGAACWLSRKSIKASPDAQSA